MTRLKINQWRQREEIYRHTQHNKIVEEEVPQRGEFMNATIIYLQ